MYRDREEEWVAEVDVRCRRMFQCVTYLLMTPFACANEQEWRAETLLAAGEWCCCNTAGISCPSGECVACLSPSIAVWGRAHISVAHQSPLEWLLGASRRTKGTCTSV